jgi:hypothetical protein
MRNRLWVSAVVASTFAVASCGSTTSVASQYSDFCRFATEMEIASAAGHSVDPSAISDPASMKSTWSQITTVALQMRDNSPAVIKDDVAVMVDSIIQMNDVFEENNYDLFAMSKDEKIRTRLDAISADKEVTSASQRFNTFMQENCAS